MFAIQLHIQQVAEHEHDDHDGKVLTVAKMGFRAYPRDPQSPVQVIFTNFRAQCTHYFYTWIPRVRVEGVRVAKPKSAHCMVDSRVGSGYLGKRLQVGGDGLFSNLRVPLRA